MSGFVDLHCHSTASDGSLSPREVAQLAHREGLSGLALTDHDTIAGLDEAAAECARLGVRFVTGIEISCVWPPPGTLHILGYCFDQRSAAMAGLCARLVAARTERNPRIIARLRELGVAIGMEEVLAEAGGEVVGRPHIAAVLARKGYVSSIQQAFDRYLAPGAAAYFPKETVEPHEGIGAIIGAGGVAVLAHPVQLKLDDAAELQRVVQAIADMGVAGIEVMHCDHTRRDVEMLSGLADRLGLLKTGGSDFHGDHKEGSHLGRAGDCRVPREFMDALVARAAAGG